MLGDLYQGLKTDILSRAAVWVAMCIIRAISGGYVNTTGTVRTTLVCGRLTKAFSMFSHGNIKCDCYMASEKTSLVLTM